MAGDFVAGSYTVTFNAKPLGQAAEGFTLSHSFFKQLVTGDAMGQTPQDAVYLGREQFVSARMIEARKTGLLDLIEPYGNQIPLLLGPIGSLDIRGDAAPGPDPPPTQYALPMVFTALPGTPAANDGPATMTLDYVAMAENFPVEQIYGPNLREVPIRCRVYPYVFDPGTPGDPSDDFVRFGSVT